MGKGYSQYGNGRWGDTDLELDKRVCAFFKPVVHNGSNFVSPGAFGNVSGNIVGCHDWGWVSTAGT